MCNCSCFSLCAVNQNVKLLVRIGYKVNFTFVTATVNSDETNREENAASWLDHQPRQAQNKVSQSPLATLSASLQQIDQPLSTCKCLRLLNRDAANKWGATKNASFH
jgi:hypothetical protein